MAFRPNWYDDERSRGGFWTASPATWSAMRWILTLTTVVFVLQLLERAWLHTDRLTEWGALRAWLPPSEEGFAAGAARRFNVFFPVQLVSYALLHAGWGHIIFNLLFLIFFGPELEATYGRRGFLRLYVGGAVAGGLLQWAYYVVTGDLGLVVGASGAVIAVLLVFAMHWPNRTILIWFVLPVPIWAFVAFFVLNNVIGLVTGTSGETAVLAHLGGAAFGFAWHRWGGMLERVTQHRERVKAVRAAEETSADRREMDRILAKIQASGLGSLESRERSFLERRSRELREQGR